MNGSENGYAGALFFALISLIALLKLNDIAGGLVSAGSAILAAISLRRALVKSAQAAEEDHQRLEIQLQQLRTKIMETSSATIEAMTAVNDAAKLAQENLQTIRIRLAELDNLTNLTKNVEEIKAILASSEENSSALNVALEKNFEAFRTLEENKKENLQSVLKLLQFITQTTKNPSYVKELEKVNLSLEKLIKQLEEDRPAAADLSRQDLSMLKRIAAKIK